MIRSIFILAALAAALPAQDFAKAMKHDWP